VPGLGTSFGRGGATTFPQDLVNSDAVLIMGSNMAEAHPVAFARVLEAKERGAKLIHVDPHFSRTSAMVDHYLQIRAGTDIAFLGGVIRWLLVNDRYFHDYVHYYTNALTVIDDKFEDTEALDGLFSGYNPETRSYDISSWQYKLDKKGNTVTDPEAKKPRTVLNLLRAHFERYTPEEVERICGVSKDDFVRVCEILADNSGRERTAAFCYALGWTQHSHGVQNIRAAAIVQLLLGNMGRPGGGIMALRGHASIQGSTDVPTLYDLLSGYMPQPSALLDHGTLEKYIKAAWRPTGWWANFPKYIVSFLKAWYGDAATKENDYRYDWVAKTNGDSSHLACTFAMVEGKIKGMLIMGQNPASGSAHARLQRRALSNLDWLVVRDLYEIESAAFWYAAPDGEDPATIKTEIFFVPAASHLEKEGSFTNTQRLVQWREKAIDPPGDARSDAWFIHQLAERLKKLYAGSKLKRDEPIKALTWDYDRAQPEPGSRIVGEPDLDRVVQEINGCEIATGKLLGGFAELKDDGTTACGSWIYSGIHPEPGRNRAASRDNRGRVFPNWGWSWPANRRILYNRASADPSGRPWSERKKYIWWDEEQKKWTGEDVPDFPAAKDPETPAKPGAGGMDALSGSDPFIMMPDGRGWLFVPKGLKDGPMPTHYEPYESPVHNAFYGQQSNPTAKTYAATGDNPLAPIGDPDHPIVMTTYRVTEHHVSGAMTRWLPWLAELQPEAFVELSPQLAAAKGVVNGGWVTVSTLRGQFEGRALVTPRMHPLQIQGKTVDQIGVPMHWSYMGVTKGDTPNDLTHLVLEPNVSIYEVKAITCDLRAGRRTGKTTAPENGPR
jgi:formate dehydrogenase major subunit